MAESGQPGGTCPFCGRVFDHLEMDHIVPTGLGGTHTIDNIQWLCHDCHLVKTKKEFGPIFSRKAMGNTRKQGLPWSEESREKNRQSNVNKAHRKGWTLPIVYTCTCGEKYRAFRLGKRRGQCNGLCTCGRPLPNEW